MTDAGIQMPVIVFWMPMRTKIYVGQDPNPDVFSIQIRIWSKIIRIHNTALTESSYDSAIVKLMQSKINATFSSAMVVLPTGRNFGRKKQKWPHKNISGRKNPRLNFSLILFKTNCR
jgi:hypothetical protein